MRTRSLALAALLSGLALPTFAAIPSTIPFQTRLVDNTGSPVPPGTVVVCSIYDDETAGNELWGPETHTVTPVNGLVSIFLGDGDTPDPIDENVFGNGDRFLELIVAGETLSPRIRMTSSAYAFRAESVSAGSINSTALASNAVTGAKIASNAVTATKIASNAVTNAKIQNSAVTNAKLGNNAVTSAKIQDNTVTGSDILNESVTGSDIDDGSVTGDDIKNGTIFGADLANETITGSKIDNGTITGADLASETITGTQIDNESVTSSDIQNGTLRDFDMADEPGAVYGVRDGTLNLPVGEIFAASAETIDAPTSGLLVCMGTVTVEINHFQGIQSEVVASLTDSVGLHNNASKTTHAIPPLAPSGLYRVTLSPSRIRSRGSGQTTMNLNVGMTTGLTGKVIASTTTIVFVPTSYGDVAAAEASHEDTAFDGDLR